MHQRSYIQVLWDVMDSYGAGNYQRYSGCIERTSSFLDISEHHSRLMRRLGIFMMLRLGFLEISPNTGEWAITPPCLYKRLDDKFVLLAVSSIQNEVTKIIPPEGEISLGPDMLGFAVYPKAPYFNAKAAKDISLQSFSRGKIDFAIDVPNILRRRIPPLATLSRQILKQISDEEFFGNMCSEVFNFETFEWDEVTNSVQPGIYRKKPKYSFQRLFIKTNKIGSTAPVYAVLPSEWAYILGAECIKQKIIFQYDRIYRTLTTPLRFRIPNIIEKLLISESLFDVTVTNVKKYSNISRSTVEFLKSNFPCIEVNE